MNMQDIEKQIIDEFNQFEEWLDKYNYIIELGKNLPLIDDAYKTKQYTISGCQSQVWLRAKYDKGLVIFEADSDALITKGIVSLLIRVLSHQKPDIIINAPLTFIDKIGLKEHLSPTRANGLLSMIKQMKLYALALKTKHEKNNE